LEGSIWPFVLFHQVLQEVRQLALLMVAALPQLAGYIFRHVPRPSFGGVETDYPKRPTVLALEQIGDHGIEASVVFIRLGPRAPNISLIVEHEVFVPVYAGDNRG